MLTKVCSRCGVEKKASAFGKSPKAGDGRKSWCKKCYSTYNAMKLRERIENDPLYVRRQSLKTNYGITLEQYEQMWESQDGMCAICKRPETVTYAGALRHLCVDHNHSTGKIRGLLCSNCNQAIGLLGDTPERCIAAADYLVGHGK